MINRYIEKCTWYHQIVMQHFFTYRKSGFTVMLKASYLILKYQKYLNDEFHKNRLILNRNIFTNIRCLQKWV